ncbi:MAG: TetR/AcrR family transcriptional regulator C-terminal ligand-binding domain-containing protein [Actinomycetota bacterium]|nr:TetR/AcrR family transcriptional regulator C-terminal ligand-binding domain-containing protein [Actinomycetota bacterium]
MKRPGGRTARVREAVFAAALAELAETGWGSLSVERIADRSGVHKTTIYRRWGTADEVVLGALLERGSEAIPVPDTGNVVDDLIALGRSIAMSISDPIGRSVAAGAIGAPDSSSIRTLADAFWSERFEQAGAIVTRGIDRGQLPGGAETSDLVEDLAARIWFRVMVSRLPVSDGWLCDVVNAAVESARQPGPGCGKIS